MSHKFQDSSDEEEEVKKGSAEDDQCPECDQVPTDDGCDCRSVSCCVCMCNNKIYNMKHIKNIQTRRLIANEAHL